MRSFLTWVLLISAVSGGLASAEGVLDEGTQSAAAAPAGKTFTGCFTAQSQYEGCRYRFVNGGYCTSEYLGRSYECLPHEKTHPYACYCPL
jgi:hypothetical protein